MRAHIAVVAVITCLLLVAVPGAPAAVPAGNLLANGNAEADVGSTDASCGGNVDVSGWEPETGAFTAVRYGIGNFPVAGEGAQFFSGGCAPVSTAAQVVDLAAAAAEIDTGTVPVGLAGQLGGYQDQRDGVTVEAFFFGPNGAELGSPGADLALTPVTREDRANQTGLVARNAAGTLPIGTRSIRVVISMTLVDGKSNDGYADDVVLAVAPPGAASPVPGADADPTDKRRPTGATVRCNRGPLPQNDSRCTMTVADAGPPPRIAPAGTVRWGVTGAGGLPFGSTCVLSVSGISPGIAFCEVTFRPGPKGTPGGTEVPVAATYEGSAVHQPISRGHKLIDATIIDPATGEKGPSDTQCGATADGLRSAPRTQPRVNQKYADPTVDALGRPTGVQEGVFSTVGRNFAWCTETGGKGLLGVVGTVVVGGTSLVYTGAFTAGGGAAGLEVAGPLGAVAAGGTGLAFGWEYGGKQMMSTAGGMADSTVKALQDPPDPKFKSLVRAKSIRKVAVSSPRGTRKRARSDAALLASWVTALRRTDAIAAAFSATVDKAGGAQLANDQLWEGRQMRQAIKLAGQLSTESDRLMTLGARVAKRARSARAANQPRSRRGFAKLRQRIAKQGFTKRERRRLADAGFGAAEQAVLRETAKDPKIKDSELIRPPGRLIAQYARSNLWRDTARFYRLWAMHPQVVQAARLGS